ncbi:MAG: hypothetical protein JSR25_00165 [Proteobacteria bacterium]|nr:hypothetical protein [Pseudomonadota bacterium]
MPIKLGTAMRGILVLMAMLAALPVRAAAPVLTDKPVARIDGLIAAIKGRNVVIQARGAVTGGGWKKPALRPVKSTLPGDAHTIVVEFVAQPPPSNLAVIPGLMPVTATVTVRNRKGIISVRAVSAVNEITTQILK